jgi:hypothetical protein
MAVILQSTTSTSADATWQDNQDVDAGGIATDATTAAGAASQASTILTGSAADGNTGALTIGSGAATSATAVRASGAIIMSTGLAQAGANAGGSSGAVTIQSGGTDSSALAAAPSGNVLLQSGDALSTGAGAGAASGSLSIETGTSADSTTGNIVIAPGVASTEPGRGTTQVLGLTTVPAQGTAIAGARVMSLADSGGIFSVAQSGAYPITLPVPTGAGTRYTFLADGANNDVTIQAGAGGSFQGTIINGTVAVVAVNGGQTKIILEAAGVLGDHVEVISASTTVWIVRAVTSNAAGITAAA